MKKEMKIYKGEKYIYLLMAYKLAKADGGYVRIGKDNGCTGGQNYYRNFNIQEYEGKTLLVETKVSKSFADFSRTFEIRNENSENPVITDYINEDFENCGQSWVH